VVVEQYVLVTNVVLPLIVEFHEPVRLAVFPVLCPEPVARGTVSVLGQVVSGGGLYVSVQFEEFSEDSHVPLVDVVGPLPIEEFEIGYGGVVVAPVLLISVLEAVMGLVESDKFVNGGIDEPVADAAGLQNAVAEGVATVGPAVAVRFVNGNGPIVGREPIASVSEVETPLPGPRAPVEPLGVVKFVRETEFEKRIEVVADVSKTVPITPEPLPVGPVVLVEFDKGYGRFLILVTVPMGMELVLVAWPALSGAMVELVSGTEGLMMAGEVAEADTAVPRLAGTGRLPPLEGPTGEVELKTGNGGAVGPVPVANGEVRLPVPAAVGEEGAVTFSSGEDTGDELKFATGILVGMLEPETQGILIEPMVQRLATMVLLCVTVLIDVNTVEAVPVKASAVKVVKAQQGPTILPPVHVDVFKEVTPLGVDVGEMVVRFSLAVRDDLDSVTGEFVVTAQGPIIEPKVHEETEDAGALLNSV